MRPWVWIAGSLLLIVASVVISFWTFRQTEDAVAARAYSYAVVAGATGLVASINDADGGLRNYLLSGDRAHLDRFVAARDEVRLRFSKLREGGLLAAPRARVDALARLLEADLGEMARLVERRRDDGLADGPRQSNLGQPAAPPNLSRAALDRLIALEQVLLVEREADLHSGLRRTAILLAVSGLLSVLLALACAWLLYGAAQQRFRNRLDVETRHRVDEQHSDSAAQVQAVLNTVVDAIITLDASGAVETVNKAAERMFGYAASELLGQDLSLLIPELLPERCAEAIADERPGHEPWASGVAREVTAQRKDGSVFPVEIARSEQWRGGQGHVTAILRDISARKTTEDALRKAAALQNAIFNSANFSYIATDAKGVIQIFNVGAERMLGYAADDVIDKITPAAISDPAEIIARADALSIELGTPIAPGFEALVFKASRGIEDVHELTYIHSDGNRLPAVVSVTALRDADETIIGYLLIGTDNTAHLRSEAERALLDQALQNKNVELDRARVVAEKANLAKSDFLSSMSHELRTPLGAILGFAQLVESGTPSPTATQKRSIDEILKAGWYLLELINEILDLALIESGKLVLTIEPVPLAEVMQECAAMIEAQARQRGVRARFVAPDDACFVSGDRTRLKQVLINLLSNAIKYNRPNGTVAVEVARGERVRISVSDTGQGLAEAQLAQLFEPFNRLGQELTSEQGSGIGLVVSKRLVEGMGGVIGVDSELGRGSVFWIELDPAQAPRDVQPVAEAAASSAPCRCDIAANVRTLLYVEDNPANLLLVGEIVARRADIRLVSARDGEEGIELARRYLPDVILMDINLPGIGGFEALKILAGGPTTARIPVIALSANALPRDISNGLQAGFFRYLTKPIRVAELLATLDLAIKSSQGTGACAAPNEKGASI